MSANTWKLQDAKARFSEVVRRAREGKPQRVTVHGKQAVVVVDAERFEIRAKTPGEKTLAGFVDRSRQYLGAAEGLKFERKLGMRFRDKRSDIFDADFAGEGEQ